MRGPRGGGRAKKKGRELKRITEFDTPIAPPQVGWRISSLRAFRQAILRFKRVGWSGGKWIAKIDTKIDPKSMPNRWVSELEKIAS